MPISAMRHPSCVSRDYLPQLRVVPPTPLKPGEEQNKRKSQSPNHLREEEWLVYCGKPPAAAPPKLETATNCRDGKNNNNNNNSNNNNGNRISDTKTDIDDYGSRDNNNDNNKCDDNQTKKEGLKDDIEVVVATNEGENREKTAGTPPSPASEASTQFEASLWCQQAVDPDESLWNPDGIVSKQKQLYHDVVTKLANEMRTQLANSAPTLSTPPPVFASLRHISVERQSRSNSDTSDCNTSPAARQQGGGLCSETGLSQPADRKSDTTPLMKETAPPISTLPVASKVPLMCNTFRQAASYDRQLSSPSCSPRSRIPVRRISTPRSSDCNAAPSLSPPKVSPTRVPQNINYINMKVGSDEMKLMLLPGVSVGSLVEQFSEKYKLKTSTKKKLEGKLQMLLELQSSQR